MSKGSICRLVLWVTGLVGCVALASCTRNHIQDESQAEHKPVGYPIEIRYFDPEARPLVSVDSEVVGTAPMTLYLDIGRPIRVVVSESTGERAIFDLTITETGGQSVSTQVGGVQLSGNVLTIIEAPAQFRSY